MKESFYERCLVFQHNDAVLQESTAHENSGSPLPTQAVAETVLLLLCPDEDTVYWCRLAEEYARTVLPGVQTLYWARGDPFPELLEQWRGDWLVSFRGDLVVPERIFSRAAKGAINFHPSPPWFRGLGGQHYAIYDGHDTYGTTCHHLAASIDAGSIIDVKTFAVAPGETTSALRQHVGAYSLAQFYEVVSKYLARGVPLPETADIWGDKLYTSAALRSWLEEVRIREPSHPCLR